MSRIRVGDITIDEGSVQIGGAEPGRPAAAAVRPAPSPLPSLVRRIPVPPLVLAGAGAAMLAAGTAVNVLVGVFSDPLTALARGGILAPLGFGMLVLAGLTTVLRRRPAAELVSALGGDVDGHVARLRPLLDAVPAACTVAALATRAGWPEPTVVRVLALMRERGEVSEELDLDTGQFYYTTRTLPPRDLQSRLATLHP